MKSLSLALGLLLNQADPVGTLQLQGNSISENNLKIQKNGKKMISVGLRQIEFSNNRYDDFIEPLSSKSNMVLAQALNLKTVTSKDGHITLMQHKSNSTRDIVDN